MALSPGEKLGPYEIVSPLGAGGMGEVYKARDTRLDRTVAVKVLPSHIAKREDLRARFEREARAVSSLKHPNICSLFDVGSHDGVGFMVMEHLDGETLAERIKLKGALPLDLALKYAMQIADALDRAHRQGVVHRDIKPPNIMVTRDGVKVLDFGLAKTAPTKTAADDATLTAALTSEGSFIGTPQYMAPEQYEGKEADARSDIFAFGGVVYEMVTGKRTFDGKTRASVVAAVIGGEPQPMSSVQPVTPRALERLVQRCLIKDPDERYQSMWDVLLELRSVTEAPEQQPAVAAKRGSWIPWAAAAICLILAAVSTALWLRRPSPDSPTLRFSIEPPQNAAFAFGLDDLAVSPDGRMAVFSAGGRGAGRMLWLHSFDSLTARSLSGVEDAATSVWSPDSKSVAFFSAQKLKRIDVAGGPPMVICDSPGSAYGGSWNRDGVILFRQQDGLYRVAASGGTATRVTTVDGKRQELDHRFPYFLPDGRQFLFLVAGSNPSTSGIYAASLDRPNDKTRIVPSDTKAVYALSSAGGPGYLLWMRQQTLVAQRFDPDHLRLEGEPFPIVQEVAVSNAFGTAAFSASHTGLLVYRGGETQRSRISWVTRDGKREPSSIPEDDYGYIRISPDGRRVAMRRGGVMGNWDIWLFEFARSLMTRLTFDAASESYPLWSPDGKFMVYSSNRSGPYQLYRKQAGGGGQEERLTEGSAKTAMDWSRDGRYLLYRETGAATQMDLMAVPAEGDRKPIPVVNTQFSESSGQFSPEGKWIAYGSNESGRAEIYIQAFPSSGGKWQVSTSGGTYPRWRADGKELYFFAPGNGLMAASIRVGPGGIETDTPRELFQTSPPIGVLYPYDVTADGQRFLVMEPTDAGGSRPLTAVYNWQAALKP